MADLGAIADGAKPQNLGSSYLVPASGNGRIAGVVKQNGVDALGHVMVIDTLLSRCIASHVGSSFDFKGLSTERQFILIARHLQSTSFNALVYDKITPTAL